jgi:hypothetical protein
MLLEYYNVAPTLQQCYKHTTMLQACYLNRDVQIISEHRCPRHLVGRCILGEKPRFPLWGPSLHTGMRENWSRATSGYRFGKVREGVEGSNKKACVSV